MNILMIFLIPFVFSLMVWPVAKMAGNKFDFIDYPDRRKIHSVPTLKVGGFLIIAGYVVGILLFWTIWSSFLLCLLLIFITGVLGDKDLLTARQRLVVQSAIAIIFILLTGSIVKNLGIFEIPFYLSIPFTLIGIVGLVNAYNIVDGIDGLCSGLGIISLLSIGVLAYIYGDNQIATHAFMFSAAVSGFLLLNLKKKTFAGDAGSYMIGFMVSALSVSLSNRTADISPFAFLLNVLIPVFDTLFSIWRRRRLRKDPLKPDRRHLHHMLSRRYHNRTSSLLVILFLQIILSILAVLFHRSTYLLIFIILLAILFLRRLWFKKIKISDIMIC